MLVMYFLFSVLFKPTIIDIVIAIGFVIIGSWRGCLLGGKKIISTAHSNGVTYTWYYIIPSYVLTYYANE